MLFEGFQLFREKDRGSKCCLKMIDKMTQIFDPENPSKIYPFFITEKP